MLKRVFGFILVGAAFFVVMQFISVLFYAWEFDDFANDEVKFAPIREDGSKEHLVEHMTRMAQYYGLNLADKGIIVDKSTDPESGIRWLAVDIRYTTPVDLYYFTYHIRRHVLASTRY